MDTHIVKILKTEFVTHNVKRFVVEKPARYTFIPGQATDVSINQSGFIDELRPFTFTSHVDDDCLEFTIKIYTGHNGVTEKLSTLIPGDELILHEVFGAIAYKGPGVFIAGGAGITPFIAILRQLEAAGKLHGNTLLFANRTENDIILKNELTRLLGDAFINVIDRPLSPAIPARHITGKLLEQYIKPDAFYYICGPDKFIEEMMESLKNLGAKEAQIVIEQ